MNEEYRPIFSGRAGKKSVFSSFVGYIKRKQELISNLSLALCYFFFVKNNLVFLYSQFRFSVLMLAILYALVGVIALVRRPPQRISMSLEDICITIVGTYSPIMFIGVGNQEETIIFQAVGLVGLSIAILGVIALNASFGLLPADRGVVRGGIYRYIRHPIYAGYFISATAFLVQNISAWNLAFFALFFLGETMRLIREEKLLRMNPDYLEYMQKTRWRIVPYVW